MNLHSQLGQPRHCSLFVHDFLAVFYNVVSIFAVCHMGDVTIIIISSLLCFREAQVLRAVGSPKSEVALALVFALAAQSIKRSPVR